MFAIFAAAVDFFHALVIVVWIAGVPLLFTRRWPRLRKAYAIYAVTFVILTRLSMLVLGECFLTALVRPLWRHAGEVATDEWFTVRAARAVFGMTPSHRWIAVTGELLMLVTAVGVLFQVTGGRLRTFLRRAVTIPGVFGLWLVDLALLPVTLTAALVVDLLRGRSFALVRFRLVLTLLLSFHVVGLAVLAAARLGAGSLARAEAWWARTLWRAAVRLYRMRVFVEGADVLLAKGPIVLMSRHASLIDVLLPLVAAPHFVAHFVAKRALLWDPCIDLASGPLHNAFVVRGGRDHAGDVAAVTALADEIGDRDLLAIFPEGTRATDEKRARMRSPYRHLLPPHTSGPLRILAHCRRADVVFCAHHGLEGASHLRDLASGSLVGRTICIRFWRVPAAEIPRESSTQRAWLEAWWHHIDDWVDAARRLPLDEG